MSDNEDSNSIIEEDSTYSGIDSIIEDKEDTAEIITLETSKNEVFNREFDQIIEDFKIGKGDRFKAFMLRMYNSIGLNHLRINELEQELEEIKSQFYRNELSDEDFDDILLLDEDE